jgi:hypothetical protein
MSFQCQMYQVGVYPHNAFRMAQGNVLENTHHKTIESRLFGGKRKIYSCYQDATNITTKLDQLNTHCIECRHIYLCYMITLFSVIENNS